MSALALRRESKTTGRSVRARSPRQQTVVKPALSVVPRRRRWPAVIGALAWSALFVGLLGAAVFHTQLAERQLRIDRLDRAVAEQRELFDELRYERAELRSPVRLAAAAGAIGMVRGDSSDFVRVTPEAVALQLAAAGTLDPTSRVIVETDPLQQFRDVKAVTAGELSDAAKAADPDPAATDPATTDPAATDPAATVPAVIDPAAVDPAVVDPAAPAPVAAPAAAETTAGTVAPAAQTGEQP